VTAYYNEIDEFAAAWLRNLIAAGHIAPGDVDTRSIEDVRPDDLRSYTQCHFFAGIGVWSHALRASGWDDDRAVWTGSCPCQPFSAAGKGIGFADERHLWPAFFWLIQRAKPLDVPLFGEQVASKDGLAWIDLVRADMEGAGHSIGVLDTCSAGFGAPHIRQRLHWMAYCHNSGLEGRGAMRQRAAECVARARGVAGIVADRDSGAGEQGRAHDRGRHTGSDAIEGAGLGGSGVFGALADDDDVRGQQRLAGLRIRRPYFHDADGRSPLGGFWADAEWIACRDGKWRPVEPGTFPLAHGAVNRVGRLRGYGNAINAQQTAAFIEACLDLLP
jgi:DNA (cytosine-5)-methyltransferase 1